MTYFMGIDGGGSNLRVAITTPNLTVCAKAYAATVNPSIIGHAPAAKIIRDTMQEAIIQANLTPADITSVGIGIAGAVPPLAENWLREVVNAVTPQTYIVPSVDFETALVGAHGQRYGILVLAGTGSVAYGINEAGEKARVGGWGYLMGDEGSGYWLGIQALRFVMHAYDGRENPTTLTESVLTALNLKDESYIPLWLHQDDTTRNRDIARLAPLVMEAATAGDDIANRIVDSAVQELLRLCQTAIRRLDMSDPPIAFAGGLLENPTLLSTRLCELLDLPAIPTPKYPPMIGAALLAKIEYEQM
jgi:glucosamine kinase